MTPKSLCHILSYFKSPKWTLNNSLLLDLDFKKVITKDTELFFKKNESSEIRFGTVWEAYKATCRGWIVNDASYKKKKANQKLEKNWKTSTKHHLTMTNYIRNLLKPNLVKYFFYRKN